MNVLSPNGPFLFIQWDPSTRLCDVKGTLHDKALAYEILERAKRTLDDHFAELQNKALVERPTVQIVTDLPH